MKAYKWILFDADDTLFHFDAFSGLKHMFSHFGIQFTQDDYCEYQTLNTSLWVEYQNNKITAQELQQRRFYRWEKRLRVPAQELNKAFLISMAEICQPLDGATDLLHSLKGKAKMGIITNGFTELQEARLNRSGHKDFFEILVISEQVGVAKPHIDIFAHALSLMDNPNKEEVLMVGDNPDSDILGGLNAGFDTCWFNPKNNPLPLGITPHFQVASLQELRELLDQYY